MSEHLERASKSIRGLTDGAAFGRGHQLAAAAARRAAIAQLFREGRSAHYIAQAIGSTRNAVHVEIHRMRRAGWDLPYRGRAG